MRTDWVEVERAIRSKWDRAFRDPQNLPVCPGCQSADIRIWYLTWDPTPLMVAHREFMGRGFVWEWCCSCGRYRFLTCAVPYEATALNERYGEPPPQLKSLSDRLLKGSGREV